MKGSKTIVDLQVPSRGTSLREGAVGLLVGSEAREPKLLFKREGPIDIDALDREVVPNPARPLP